MINLPSEAASSAVSLSLSCRPKSEIMAMAHQPRSSSKRNAGLQSYKIGRMAVARMPNKWNAGIPESRLGDIAARAGHRATRPLAEPRLRRRSAATPEKYPKKSSDGIRTFTPREENQHHRHIALPVAEDNSMKANLWRNKFYCAASSSTRLTCRGGHEKIEHQSNTAMTEEWSRILMIVRLPAH